MKPLGEIVNAGPEYAEKHQIDESDQYSLFAAGGLGQLVIMSGAAGLAMGRARRARESTQQISGSEATDIPSVGNQVRGWYR